MSAADGSVAWYETEWFRKWGTVAFCALVAVKAVHSIFLKQNDFEWHMFLGQTGLRGTPYVQDTGPLGAHYPPGRVVIDAGLAFLPYYLARAITFTCAMAGLLVTSRIWRQLADAMQPASYAIHFAAAFFAFVLLAPWVVRDFDECGLQILLLFFISMAGWTLWRGQRLAAGAWLALAITWKSSPLILLPLLVWKRRWLEATATVGFLVVFNAVIPAVVWGPATARDALTRYVDEVRMIASLPDPAENGIEPPTHRNQNLPFAIARYLQTYRPGHPLFMNSSDADDACDPKNPATNCHQEPLFVQFLDLPAATAKRIINGILLVLGLAFAWRTRFPWALQNEAAPGGRSSALAPEWAVACALAALLSPLTWLQHLTLALPCAYLSIRDTLLSSSRGRWAALVVVFFCTWIFQRDPLPMHLSIVVMSYHEDVLAVLILIAMTLGAADGFARKPRLIQAEAARA